MRKTQISSPKLQQAGGVYSHAIAVNATGHLLFISGMTAKRQDGSIAGIGDPAEQTRQVCENLKAVVEAAGGTLDDICQIEIYVRNVDHLDKIRNVRMQYFKEPMPASTVVEVSNMASPDYLIIISAIALVPIGQDGAIGR